MKQITGRVGSWNSRPVPSLSVVTSLTVSVCTHIEENFHTNSVKKEIRKEILLSQRISQSVLKERLLLLLTIPIISNRYSDNNTHHS